MPDYDFVTVDVFTNQRFGGNPLAVFPDARGLTDAQMQAIAMEFNLSETTFVLPPDNPHNHARVRIFTPKSELAFAGHPNVGTGYVLACADSHPPEHYTFEEIAGLVRVHILRDAHGDIAGTRISAPQSLSIDISVPTALVAECVGLAEDQIVTRWHHPLIASVGTPFVLAEVDSLESLAAASPNLTGFRHGARHHPELATRFNLMVYARRGEMMTYLRTRMFAPLLGVLEDPATGSANAALAALLTSIAPGDNVDMHYEIEQGIEMGRPSLIIASARKTPEGPVEATVAGNCVPVMRGTLTL
jgi:trans-2,3-dihydro-3-hydroxyanthranilate isomerase